MSSDVTLELGGRPPPVGPPKRSAFRSKPTPPPVPLPAQPRHQIIPLVPRYLVVLVYVNLALLALVLVLFVVILARPTVSVQEPMRVPPTSVESIPFNLLEDTRIPLQSKPNRFEICCTVRVNGNSPRYMCNVMTSAYATDDPAIIVRPTLPAHVGSTCRLFIF